MSEEQDTPADQPAEPVDPSVDASEPAGAGAGAEAGAAGEPPAGSAPVSSPAPKPVQHEEKTLLGIKLHNWIFVGMILGVVLGLVTYNLDHFDHVVLKAANEAGQSEVLGKARFLKGDDEWVVMTPSGLEERIPAAKVAEVKRGAESSGGKWFATLTWWFNLFGRVIFLSALKMIIAPLILCSIIAGIVSLTGLDQLKRIGFKTIGYYMISTLVAVSLGLVAVLVLQPGKKAASQRLRAQRQAKIDALADQYRETTGEKPYKETGGNKEATPAFASWLAAASAKEAGTGHEGERFAKVSGAKGKGAGDIIRDGLIKPMLTNPFYSLANTKSLGIITFAVLLGIAIVIVGGPARPVAEFFVGFNEVILWITTKLMSLAPFCVMCLVAELVAKQGPAVFETLAWYCVTVIGGIFIHVGALLAIAHFLGGCSPWRLWQGLRDALLIAFTTRSSAATLPVTLKCVTEKLGVSPKVANFSLPVGATMNMDGTALYEGVAVIFLIQIFGGLVDAPFELTAAATLVIFFTAVMASIGAAAVPDAGLVTMVLVAEAVHLPVYYIPLIFAVDAFLDMFRTTTNVLGDSVGSLVVHRWEEGSPAGAT